MPGQGRAGQNRAWQGKPSGGGSNKTVEAVTVSHSVLKLGRARQATAGYNRAHQSTAG